MRPSVQRFRRAFAATAFVALATLPALAAAPSLKPFDAEYVANYMGMEGEAHMQLAQTGAQWKYSLRIQSSLATLSQVTTFDENGGQWRPLSGSDNASVLIKKTSKNAQYDWAKGVATWTGNVKPDRAGPVDLKPGDLDAMLVNLAIARDVTAGKPLRYRMVDEAARRTWCTPSPGRKRSPSAASRNRPRRCSAPTATSRRWYGSSTAFRRPRASCSGRTATMKSTCNSSR